MDRHELAWAAGFFDGEGWAAAEVQRGRRNAQPKAQINQADANGVPEVLERFRRAVGCGQIYGPRRHPGRIDLYSWVASSRPDVASTLVALRPWLGSLKSHALENALGLDSTGPRAAPDGSSELLAWAAGLYDGEGSTCLLKHRTHADYFNIEASITQSSDDGVPEVLARFGAIASAGRIYGPYSPPRTSDQPVYRWKAGARADVDRVVGAIWPWLGADKRVQALGALNVIRAQPVLPRGNPAWGRFKSHCIHGHEYATTRIRPFVSRGKNLSRRDSRQCLACLREYARRKREAAQMRSGGDL